MTAHRVCSVVVNAVHLWECRGCGGRWAPCVDYRAIEALACRQAGCSPGPAAVRLSLTVW